MAVAIWPKADGLWYSYAALDNPTTEPGPFLTWAAPIQLSSSGGSDPAIASWGAYTGIVWLQESGGAGSRRDVWAKRWGPTPPLLLETDDRGSAQSPRISMGRDGVATVVWIQDIGTRTEIVASRSTPTTGWTVPLPASAEVSAPPATALSDIRADSAGNITVSYTRGQSGVLQRLLASGGWEAPVYFGSGVGVVETPSLALDPDGKGIIAWRSLPASAGDIRFSEVSPTGLGSLGFVETVGQDARNPLASSDGQGSRLVLWSQWDGAIYRLMSQFMGPLGFSGTNVRVDQSTLASPQNPKGFLGENGDGLALWLHNEGGTVRLYYAIHPKTLGYWYYNRATYRHGTGGITSYDASMGVRGQAIAGWIHQGSVWVQAFE